MDLRALASTWGVLLRAERKSESTQDTYLSGLDRYLTWCEANGHPLVRDRATVNAFVADLLDAGAAPATARSPQLAVRRFSAWLAQEGELGGSPPKHRTTAAPGRPSAGPAAAKSPSFADDRTAKIACAHSGSRCIAGEAMLGQRSQSARMARVGTPSRCLHSATWVGLLHSVERGMGAGTESPSPP